MILDNFGTTPAMSYFDKLSMTSFSPSQLLNFYLYIPIAFFIIQPYP